MVMVSDNNGWNEYQRLVLDTLERHTQLIENLRSDIANLRTDVAMLKIKAGMWGLMGGVIPVAIALQFLKTSTGGG